MWKIVIFLFNLNLTAILIFLLLGMITTFAEVIIEMVNNIVKKGGDE